MNPVKKAIKKYWGKRCGEHHPDCVTCQAWAAYDRLARASERAKRKAFLKRARGE